MRYDRALIDERNTIGTQGDIEKFCSYHEPLSLDALLLCDCKDSDLLRKAIGLLKTGGVLALRGVDLSSSRNVHGRMLSEVFEHRWHYYFCRNGDEIWTRICRAGRGQTEVFWEDPSLAQYMDLLRGGVPFSYLRYGDGEWNCALETLYPGFGWQTFTPELREDVRRSLIEYHRDPCYIMALAPVYHYRDRQRQWELMGSFLRAYHLTDIRWVSTQPFNRASETGKLWPFIQHLQQSNIVIVGPERLGALKKLFPGASFVTIPDRHCHARLPAIQRAILAQKLPAIILITAGPAEVVLIHRLFEEIGDSSTMIDIGTMWGPYIGRPERGGHSAVTPERLAHNIGKQP